MQHKKGHTVLHSKQGPNTTPINNGRNNKQLINNSRITAIERTAVEDTGGGRLYFTCKNVTLHSVIISLEKRESWLIYFYCLFDFMFLSLPHSAVGWSAVYGCGMSWSYKVILLSSMTMLLSIMLIKVRKTARIRDRYNQVPHRSQHTKNHN